VLAQVGNRMLALEALPRSVPAPNPKPSICFAANNHTREQILDDFLKWNQQNPQFNPEQAAKTLIRFFKQRYPCK